MAQQTQIPGDSVIPLVGNGARCACARTSFTLDTRQEQVRRVSTVVKDTVDGLQAGVRPFPRTIAARIAITIEAREIAAADCQPKPMAGAEYHGRGAKVDAQLVDAPRLEQG